MLVKICSHQREWWHFLDLFTWRWRGLLFSVIVNVKVANFRLSVFLTFGASRYLIAMRWSSCWIVYRVQMFQRRVVSACSGSCQRSSRFPSARNTYPHTLVSPPKSVHDPRDKQATASEIVFSLSGYVLVYRPCSGQLPKSSCFQPFPWFIIRADPKIWMSVLEDDQLVGYHTWETSFTLWTAVWSLVTFVISFSSHLIPVVEPLW